MIQTTQPKMMKTQHNRISDTCVKIDNNLGLDIRLFANKNVSIDFLDVHRAVRDVVAAHGDFFGDDAQINRVVLTPDFHKGSGVPVGTVVEAKGFVIPKAIGNDICCGMRLLATDIPADKLEGHWEEIQKRLRGLFFQGKRNIPMSPRQREAVLREGLPGLLATIKDNENTGIYKNYDLYDDWTLKQNKVYERLSDLCFDLTEEISNLDEIEVPPFEKEKK